jgi:hypothetical protein
MVWNFGLGKCAVNSAPNQKQGQRPRQMIQLIKEIVIGIVLVVLYLMILDDFSQPARDIGWVLWIFWHYTKLYNLFLPRINQATR